MGTMPRLRYRREPLVRSGARIQEEVSPPILDLERTRLPQATTSVEQYFWRMRRNPSASDIGAIFQ
jgi:hypothetical protein